MFALATLLFTWLLFAGYVVTKLQIAS